MESTISQTAASLWWSNIGKSQLLAIIVTLLAFFTTSCFSGHNEVVAAIVAFTFPFIIMIRTASLATASAFATAAATSFIVVMACLYVIVAFVAAVAFVAVFAFGFADKIAENQGIDKKAVWLSYAAQLIIIFVPMLITILR
jgi:hypothetical protein